MTPDAQSQRLVVGAREAGIIRIGDEMDLGKFGRDHSRAVIR